MDFGIAMATAADSWKIVERAEALGFSHAWFYDTQMLSADCFVAMGAAAVKTSRIRLGTGVLVPSNRIAPVTANALASLNQLAPGRIDFGIGTGFTARRAMGLNAMRLADMTRYIEVVLALLAKETVEVDFTKWFFPKCNVDDSVPCRIFRGNSGQRLRGNPDPDTGVGGLSRVDNPWGIKALTINT